MRKNLVKVRRIGREESKGKGKEKISAIKQIDEDNKDSIEEFDGREIQ